MDYPKFIVSNQKGEFIRIYKGKNYTIKQRPSTIHTYKGNQNDE